jgi:RNA-directed DNA polymerase
VNDGTDDENLRRVRELEPRRETQARWGWVERTVWNERMLEALETGVRGGKWHNLRDKVYRPENLRSAWARVKANHGKPGIDGMTVAEYDKTADIRLEKLGQRLREGTYQPQPVRRVYIPKPGSRERRPLGIPVVEDRIVQTALLHVIEPIYEREFEESSYGFRPARGGHDAFREIERLLAAGYHHVVDIDIRKCFESIPHRPLMVEVGTKIADGAVLGLIEAFLKQGVLEELALWKPEEGTPQGAVISPLLANIYLHPVDRALRAAGYSSVRYADDMVILCKSREEAEAALQLLGELLTARGLQLHPEKTRLAHLMVRPGFQFLGYVFFSRFRDPRASSEDKLRAKLRQKTRLTNGHSLQSIIESVNASLRGWFAYFKYCSPNSFVWERVDGWLRYRLRAILDKRRHCGRQRRRGKGYAQNRWPNDFFTRLGLFSLRDGRKLVLQP